MKKAILILAMLFWCNTSFALPECEGDYTKWTNCSYTFENGNKYVGEWKKGKLHGQGTHIWANGNKYVGEYKNDKMHGYGTFTSPPGHKYVGKWKNGRKHGQGTFTWADGNKYVGGWKKGKKYGVGTLTEADGTVKKLLDGKTYISFEEKAKAKAEAKEDKQIAKAQSVCRKVGFTPGTDKFADCTLKMLTTAKSTNQGQGQTIIVGPPRKYPKVACDAMGGLVC
jgi:hypothetical protein